MLAWIAIVLRGFNSGGALRAIQYSCVVFHETCQTFVSTVSQPKISKFRRTSYTKNSPDIRFCSHCPLIQRIPILIRYGPPTNAFSQPNHAYMHYTSATRILVATMFFSTRTRHPGGSKIGRLLEKAILTRVGKREATCRLSTHVHSSLPMISIAAYSFL